MFENLAQAKLQGEAFKFRPHLLCDQTHRSLHGKWLGKPFQSFFPADNKAWHTMSCRVVYEDILNLNQNLISPIFTIHKKTPRLKMHTHSAWAVDTDNVALGRSTVLEFKYTNKGKADVYLRLLHSAKSFMRTRPVVYKQLGPFGPNPFPRWFGDTKVSNLEWEIKGDAKIVSTQSSHTLIKVPSQGELLIEGQASHRMDCRAYHSKANICGASGHYILLGVLTEYGQLPVLQQNAFNSLEK